MRKTKTVVAIAGTAGIPAAYGGFETLVENLARYHQQVETNIDLIIYSDKTYAHGNVREQFDARIIRIPISANGASSILYDLICMLISVYYRHNTILLLGVSGGLWLPFIKFLTRATVIVNVDGVEWRRDKWNFIAKSFLKLSEKLAVRNADVTIADNKGICDLIQSRYQHSAEYISYGGDHVLKDPKVEPLHVKIPFGTIKYAFKVCRIEPENNIDMLLEAFSELNGDYSLVIVGNWNNSDYGRRLRSQYSDRKNFYLLDPIYQLAELRYLRENASFFMHGHSAGGTNPALVEAMHFGKAIFAFNCNFNRYTTLSKAIYFKNSAELVHLIQSVSEEKMQVCGDDMKTIARKHYTWDRIARQYLSLLGRP